MDRGDEFYDQFALQHSAVLTEQEAGIGAFSVLVAEDGSVCAGWWRREARRLVSARPRR